MMESYFLCTCNYTFYTKNIHKHNVLNKPCVRLYRIPNNNYNNYRTQYTILYLSVINISTVRKSFSLSSTIIDVRANIHRVRYGTLNDLKKKKKLTYPAIRLYVRTRKERHFRGFWG